MPGLTGLNTAPDRAYTRPSIDIAPFIPIGGLNARLRGRSALPLLHTNLRQLGQGAKRFIDICYLLMNDQRVTNMFSLSISASVILGASAEAERVKTPPKAAPRRAESDASVVTLSVMPSSSRRWAIDVLGVGTAEPHDTFDIRVGWSDGAYSELLGVPLGLADTLVVDRSSELSVYGVSDEIVLPRCGAV